VVNAVIAPEGAGRWVEYAGGYSDMLAQRGKDFERVSLVNAAAPKEPSERKAAPPAPSAGKRRLSFHEKHALETLPKAITALQARIRTLQTRLDDPGLYARDRAAFTQISEELAAAQAELAAAEEKWLELEILREELQGG
jgi:ATP-binding cassette subfamily F protein uup